MSLDEQMPDEPHEPDDFDALRKDRWQFQDAWARHDQLKPRDIIIRHFSAMRDFDTLRDALHERYQLLMTIESTHIERDLLHEQTRPELVILRRMLCAKKRVTFLNKLFGLIESEETEKGRRYMLLRIAIKCLVKLAQDDDSIVQGKRSDEELLGILRDVLRQKMTTN